MPKFHTDFVKIQAELDKGGFTLKKHQKEGIQQILDLERTCIGGILADEMGLGKTIQMISAMIANPVKTTLIVLPASLIHQWIRELKKFYPSITPIIHWGADRITIESLVEISKQNSIVITTYGHLINSDILKAIKYNRLICDEAHYFRNKKSKTYKALESVTSEIKWAITGTPIQNYSKDIKTLFEFIGFEIECEDDIHDFIESNMIRRTKDEVNIEIPSHKTKLHFVSFQKIGEEKLYNRINKEMGSLSEIKPLEKILRLRQTCIIPKGLAKTLEKKYKERLVAEELTNAKLNAIVKTIGKNTDERPVVFTHFRHEIEYLKALLTRKGINVGVISGGISHEERNMTIKDESLKVLLVQISAGGTGLNLQHYDTVYFTAPNWNPSLEQQAIARVHRIGQKKNVKVRKFIMGSISKATIEKRIIEVQKIKNRIIETFIN